MKKKSSFLKVIIIFIGFLAITSIAFADPVGTSGGTGDPDPVGTSGGTGDPSSSQSIKLDNPLGENGIKTIPDLVKAILEIALKIGVPLIALAIIYAGFKFITAQGNTTKLEEAKQTMVYVVVGAAILLAAYAIATAIVNTVSSVTG